MPAWITSLLRELVSMPMAALASSTTVSMPRNARARAQARPTTPAPITAAPIFSVMGLYNQSF